MSKDSAQALTPLLISATDAAKMLGISRASFYSGLSSGRIGPNGIKIGGRRLFSVEELNSWVRLRCPSRYKFLELIKNAKGKK